jgi:hypothetical protein
MGPASYGALDPATRQTGHTVFQATRIGRTFFEDPTPTAAPQTSNRTGWSGNARLSEGPARSRVITWDLNGSSFAARTGLALQRASPPRGADSAAPVGLNPRLASDLANPLAMPMQHPDLQSRLQFHPPAPHRAGGSAFNRRPGLTAALTIRSPVVRLCCHLAAVDG